MIGCRPMHDKFVAVLTPWKAMNGLSVTKH